LTKKQVLVLWVFQEMIIVSVTMVRNEADVIEAFVRHHLGFVDQMIIIDHLSIDDTLTILNHLKAEGAPVEIVKNTRQEFLQAEASTAQMRRAAQEFGADWVLPLDADEFLTSDEDPSVRPLLDKLSPDQVYQVPWRNYVPRAEDELNDSLLFDRIPYRRTEEPFPIYKVFVPRKYAINKKITLKVGNHGIRKGKRRKKTIRPLDAEQLHLAHFPVRSIAQLTSKALLGWAARLASHEQKGNMNYHLKRLFEEIRTGRKIDSSDLMSFALEYGLPESLKDIPQELTRDRVVSPNGDVVLRYSSGIYEVDLVRALAGLSEDLGNKLAAERKKSRWKKLFSHA